MLYKNSKYHINYYDFVMYIKVKKNLMYTVSEKGFFFFYLKTKNLFPLLFIAKH